MNLQLITLVYGVEALYDSIDNTLVVFTTNIANETRTKESYNLASNGINGNVRNLSCTINNSGNCIVSFHSIEDNTIRTTRYVSGTGWDSTISILHTSTAVVSNNYIKLADNGHGLAVFQESANPGATGNIITYATNDSGATWTQVTFGDTNVQISDISAESRFFATSTQTPCFAMDNATGESILVYGKEDATLDKKP